MDFERYWHKLSYPINKSQADWESIRDAYFQEGRELKERFFTDAIEELGLTGHPKAQLLMEIAWDIGHSGSYQERFGFAEDLARLLK